MLPFAGRSPGLPNHLARGSPLIKSIPPLKVALTASWEEQLADIQDGAAPAHSFATAIVQFVQAIFPKIIATPGPLGGCFQPRAFMVDTASCDALC